MFTFVEDEKFIQEAKRLLTEGELFGLMWKLVKSPDAGDMIPGSGGYRKLRFAAKGKGSRGGARVIYFYDSHAGKSGSSTSMPKTKKPTCPPTNSEISNKSPGHENHSQGNHSPQC